MKAGYIQHRDATCTVKREKEKVKNKKTGKLLFGPMSSVSSGADAKHADSVTAASLGHWCRDFGDMILKKEQLGCDVHM